MPELPDLEAFSLNLQKELSGKRLQKLTAVNKSKLKIPEKELKSTLENQELKRIYREGKELRFEFADGNILGLHLMLNGDMYLFEKSNEHKYPIVELLFDDDTGLVVTDFQGMANIALNPEEKTSPDALSGEMDFKYLKEQLMKTRTVIKKLLMKPEVIRGIGNAYADEILWHARISPLSVCNKIQKENIKVLAKSTKTVLQNAIKQIHKTKPGIISGEVRDFLDIHNSTKKKSPTGADIKQIMIGGRKTYYTDEQELFI